MLYRLETWLFGCTCSGPCNHTHGRFQEWLWNTDHLYRFLCFIWHKVLRLTPVFEG